MSNLIAKTAFALSCLLLGFTIMNVAESKRLAKRVNELDEWMQAHHKWSKLDEGGAFDNHEYYLNRAGTSQFDTSRGDIILQPGESFTDTVTFYSPPTTGQVGLPSWSRTDQVIDKWKKTFKLYPDTTSARYYHDFIDGEVIRVREEVLYIYTNGHWRQCEIKR